MWNIKTLYLGSNLLSIHSYSLKTRYYGDSRINSLNFKFLKLNSSDSWESIAKKRFSRFERKFAFSIYVHIGPSMDQNRKQLEEATSRSNFDKRIFSIDSWEPGKLNLWDNSKKFYTIHYYLKWPFSNWKSRVIIILGPIYAIDSRFVSMWMTLKVKVTLY